MATKKVKVQMYQTYKVADLILPKLNLGQKVEIQITVDEKDVILTIGPRDWQWDRKTGGLVGAGTCIG